MFDKIKALFEDADFRFYLYGVVSAVLYVLAAKGAIEGSYLDLLLALAAAALNVAQKNVDRSEGEEDSSEA